MNTIQIHCHKEMFIETKKNSINRNVYGNPNNKREMNKNKKATTKNRMTQTQTNNIGNEHDKKSKPIFFASKYLVCNFSKLQ